MTLDISIDDLLKQLQAEECSDAGFTTKELRLLWGVGDLKARSLIEVGLNSGRLRRGKKWMEKISGVRSPQPCWIPVAQK